MLTEFFSYSPHKSCVCFSVYIRAKTGASWGQATGTGGLKSERSYLVYWGLHFIEASVLRTRAPKVWPLLTNDARCRDAEWLSSLLCNLNLLNKPTSASHRVIRLRIIIKRTIRYAFLVCTCHIVWAFFITNACIHQGFHFLANVAARITEESSCTIGILFAFGFLGKSLASFHSIFRINFLARYFYTEIRCALVIMLTTLSRELTLEEIIGIIHTSVQFSVASLTVFAPLEMNNSKVFLKVIRFIT